MLAMLKRPALFAALALALAPAASAGDLGLSLHLGKKGKGIHVSYHKGARGPVASGRIVSSRRPITHRAPRKVWTPGHYQTVARRVWIPETYQKVYIEPVYETRYDECGRPITVLVREGYWTSKCIPGYYETRHDKVWVPGRWTTTYVRY